MRCLQNASGRRPVRRLSRLARGATEAQPQHRKAFLSHSSGPPNGQHRRHLETRPPHRAATQPIHNEHGRYLSTVPITRMGDSGSSLPLSRDALALFCHCARNVGSRPLTRIPRPCVCCHGAIRSQVSDLVHVSRLRWTVTLRPAASRLSTRVNPLRGYGPAALDTGPVEPATQRRSGGDRAPAAPGRGLRATVPLCRVSPLTVEKLVRLAYPLGDT